MLRSKRAGVEPIRVDRYTTGARINHWITATCLVLLGLSGLALFHPSLFFLTNIFGGGQNTRMIHPWIGVVLFFSFFVLFFRFVLLNLWERSDTIWLLHLGDVLENRDEENEELVEIGKYNAGQTIVFWSMSLLVRGTIRGYVTGGWRWRHHRKWLREILGRSEDRHSGTSAAA
jgi:formate dehydrogenase subunit gamma